MRRSIGSLVRIVLASIALAWLLFAGHALAQPRQPDGTVIPDGNSLQSYFTQRMEMGLDARRDAAVMPERFQPGCTIRFQVVVRDSGYENAFGWYNVTMGRAPMASELYELVSPSAPVGTMATLNFLGESRYRGGEIGFYLRTPPGHVYYSERAYQPDRQVSGGFIHVLIYDSRATPNSFYFAWEDLFNGGDNDFQDLLVIVDNLVCSGGGASCETSAMGACATGVQQCRNGVLTCMRSVNPVPERCDGIDNDCNGQVDDGMNLCPTTQLCDRGVCVERCLGELGCRGDLVCTDRGSCVEEPCARMDCPMGQYCRNGTCRGACEGVVCPRGQVCRAARCVDPCAGITCDGDQVCVAGVCQTRCPCRRCPAGENCFTDGRCRAAACATVMCPAGFLCEAGQCRDACAGAVCPGGQRCERGACTDPPPDAGTPDAGGNRPDAPSPPRDVGTAPLRDVGTVFRDAAADAFGVGTTVSQELPDTGANCACEVPGAPPRGGARGAVGLLAVALGALLNRGRYRRR